MSSTPGWPDDFCQKDSHPESFSLILDLLSGFLGDKVCTEIFRINRVCVQENLPSLDFACANPIIWLGWKKQGFHCSHPRNLVFMDENKVLRIISGFD